MKMKVISNKLKMDLRTKLKVNWEVNHTNLLTWQKYETDNNSNLKNICKNKL